MVFRKEDVETALRQTNLQLEDAVGRGGDGGMPGRGMPPEGMFGPRGGNVRSQRLPRSWLMPPLPRRDSPIQPKHGFQPILSTWDQTI